MTDKKINKKRIILCLDIDQTIFSHDCPEEVLDYNGSDSFDDPSAWVNLLSEMKAYCEAHSFELVVQIVTAKSGVDLLVCRAFYALESFLLPFNKYGKATRPFDDPTEGYASQDLPLYFIQHWDMVKRCKPKNKPETLVTDDMLLPPIHICGSRSKASAIKYIADHFLEETPAENIFLLDDQEFNLRDIQRPPYGYQGVSAYRL